MDFVTVLADNSRPLASSPVLAAYAAAAASVAMLLVSVLRLIGAPRLRTFAAVSAALAVTVLSVAWLNDTWRSEYPELCRQHPADFCRGADPGPPLWPFGG